MSQTAEDILKDIVKGKVEKIAPKHERHYKLVEQGSRIPNTVMLDIVKRMRESGIEHKEILRKVLYFDYLAERDELLDYINESSE